jgi:nucleotide-binding universal stress UspA family protein
LKGEKKMRKILVAIDDSDGSAKAVDFIGKTFSGLGDVHVTLLHVLSTFPQAMWDDGHILSHEERSAREQVIDKWVENQRLRLSPMFEKATRTLVEDGIKADQIETATVTDTLDIAEKILHEVEAGGYQIVAVGRHGSSKGTRKPIGTVANTVVSRASDMTVCIV